MSDGELLRDEATHGVADHMYRGGAGSVQDGSDVGGHRRDAHRPGRHPGPAAASVVE